MKLVECETRIRPSQIETDLEAGDNDVLISWKSKAPQIGFMTVELPVLNCKKNLHALFKNSVWSGPKKLENILLCLMFIFELNRIMQKQL